jgi:hypothetical protein
MQLVATSAMAASANKAKCDRFSTLAFYSAISRTSHAGAAIFYRSVSVVRLAFTTDLSIDGKVDTGRDVLTRH